MDPEEKTKECALCRQILPLGGFAHAKNGYIYYACKTCLNKKYLDNATQRHGDIRKCPECNLDTPASSFGRFSVCSKCVYKRRRKRREEQIETEDELYECESCKEKKPRNKFNNSTRICISCDTSTSGGRVLYVQTRMNSQCANCGFSDWRTLEFAHLGGTDKARRSNGRTMGICNIRSRERVEDELKLGRFLCAFCHRIETHGCQDFWKWLGAHKGKRRRRIMFIVFKKCIRRCCVDCKRVFDPDLHHAFDFDHRPGFEKKCDVSKMTWKNASLDEIREEINKCDLRCANCHKIKTIERLQEKKRKSENVVSEPSPKRQKLGTTPASREQDL